MYDESMNSDTCWPPNRVSESRSPISAQVLRSSPTTNTATSTEAAAATVALTYSINVNQTISISADAKHLMQSMHTGSKVGSRYVDRCKHTNQTTHRNWIKCRYFSRSGRASRCAQHACQLEPARVGSSLKRRKDGCCWGACTQTFVLSQMISV